MKEVLSLTGGVLGTNTYIVPLVNKNCFVVDPAIDAHYIAQVIRSADLSLTTILLTHGHYDHMESLANLVGLFPQARIAIHGSEAHTLGEDALLRHYAQFASTGLTQLYSAFQSGFRENPHLPEPTLLLKEGDIFEGEWRVLHTPGHTTGSICLYNEKKHMLISGDTLFYMGWGRTDLEGGNHRDLQKSLKRLYSLPSNTRVFPGHEQYDFPLGETDSAATRSFFTI